MWLGYRHFDRVARATNPSADRAKARIIKGGSHALETLSVNLCRRFLVECSAALRDSNAACNSPTTMVASVDAESHSGALTAR
jgi:hypothetical protein